MNFTVFNKNEFDFMQQPMFLGEQVNVARYDKMRHRKFEQLTEAQHSFFWRPQEINLSKDRADFMLLPEHEQHIFVSNLKYQILLDSIQGRAPSAVLLPLVSDPQLEAWTQTWSFSETIHSNSYTHIIRNVLNDPSKVFDEICQDTDIVARAAQIAGFYDELHHYSLIYQQTGKATYDLRKALYLCLVSINVLEAVRFYVSFACSFAFAERGLMRGNANIIKLIARDEALHLSGTQYILRKMQSGSEGEEFQNIAKECQKEAEQIFVQAVEQELNWVDYLFRDGEMVGLTRKNVKAYIYHLADKRMRSCGMASQYQVTANPIPWMNSYLTSMGNQSAPQETEVTTYLTNDLETQMGKQAFSACKL